MSNRQDYEWVLQGGYQARLISAGPQGPVYQLTGPLVDDGQHKAYRNVVRLTYGADGRVLLDGENVELDERVWGLTDELIDANLVVGGEITIEPADDDEVEGVFERMGLETEPFPDGPESS